MASDAAPGMMSGADKAKLDALPAYTSRSYTQPASRSLVSAAAAANGFQVSATRDAFVTYSVLITTSVQIGVAVNVDGAVVLEINPANTAVAGEWVTIASTPNSQSIGLAVALSSTNKGGGQICGMVPAGYYCRIRQISNSGSPVFSYVGGQETLL